MKKTIKVLAVFAGYILVCTLAAAVVGSMTACTRTVYVDSPTPVAVVSPPPVAPTVQQCKSVPRNQGDCHETTRDVYLTQYTNATDAAFLNPAVMWKDEISSGPAYLAYIIERLQAQGLCAAIYQNEEIAVWSKADQTFSENWDAIREPAGGGIYQRLGPGAHGWDCNPATTESGS